MKFLQLIIFVVCINVGIGMLSVMVTGGGTDVFGDSIEIGLGGENSQIAADRSLVEGAQIVGDDSDKVMEGSDNQQDPSDEGWGSGTTKAGGIWSSMKQIMWGFPNLLEKAIPAADTSGTSGWWIVFGTKAILGFAAGYLILMLILRFNPNEL